MCELGQMRLRIADVERFEHLGHAAVQADPVGSGNFLVERVSRQRVAEPQATDCAGGSSTTRAVIASSSTLSSLSIPV
jgi:hypothetical protein